MIFILLRFSSSFIHVHHVSPFQLQAVSCLALVSSEPPSHRATNFTYRNAPDSLTKRPASKNPAKIMCYLSRKPSLLRA